MGVRAHDDQLAGGIGYTGDHHLGMVYRADDRTEDDVAGLAVLDLDPATRSTQLMSPTCPG